MFRKIKVVLDICQYQCGLKYTIIKKTFIGLEFKNI